MKKKRWWRGLFLLYSFIIVKMIIFKYPLSMLWEVSKSWGEGFIRQGIESANFIPFKTITMYLHYYGSLNSFENLIGNILIFIPLGLILPRAFKLFDRVFWMTFFSFVFILDIELFQLVTRFGEFDIDDIILNLAGCMMGFAIGRMSEKVKVLLQEKKKERNEESYES